ncbi:Nickel-dependent hydrogenase [Desulfonema limicola]|uniref:Nickel-dependent hydrogenase n=1 Tax=Desulfonema limicola TaxID=45656 RepID=A0A975GJT1_9BACT|nr:nickel-dependent hydrogenase large subunit [Desulfonema limicola]QTA83936.1 Nickel-dependent hydrogenase [Desulfonema limicola]
MSKKQIIQVPLNRVEGDLEIRAEVKDGYVVDAWSSGTMYRGFESILKGRGALDGLVITPRICGICNTSHLAAAARALNMIASISPPPDAVKIINLALMTEHIQSDIRHGILMFCPDFVNPAYKHLPLFEEAVKRFSPFKGESVRQVIRETKKILELSAIIGGQWPHSSFIVPGGIVSNPDDTDILKCKIILHQYKNWYEKQILGCTIERWLQVESVHDLDTWLEEKDSHRQSDLGFYIRYAKEIGLDKIGKGCQNFISYGAYEVPGNSDVKAHGNSSHLVPPGFFYKRYIEIFDQKHITEHVASSWYMDYDRGKHPFEGETKPFASGKQGSKYSWAKAPRYNDLPGETGPLADMIISENRLFTDYNEKNGPDVFIRELARLTRPSLLMPVMETWLSEISGKRIICLEEFRKTKDYKKPVVSEIPGKEKFYISSGEIPDGRGFGMVGAARGSLGHWVSIADNMIKNYQIITPTAWNLSPRDSDGVRGPAEEALLGTGVADISNPVQLGHVIRSFDVCMVCTVHAIEL